MPATANAEAGPSRPPAAPQANANAAANVEAGPSRLRGVGDDHASAVANGVVKPAPTVVQASQHGVHTLPRRFLGPMPASHVYSDQTEEKRARLRHMKRRAMKSMLGDQALLGLPTSSGSGANSPGKRALHKFRVKRKSILAALDEDEAFEVASGDSSDTSDSDGTVDSGWLKKKKKQRKKKKGKKAKKKAKGVFSTEWIGDSFDIGREFEGKHGKAPDPAVSGAHPDDMVEADRGGSAQAASNRRKAKDELKRLANEGATEGQWDSSDDDTIRPRITDSPESFRLSSKDSSPEQPRTDSPTARPESPSPLSQQTSRLTSRRGSSAATSTIAESFVTAPTRPLTSRDDSSDFHANLEPPSHPALTHSVEPSPHSSPLMKGSSAADSTRPLISDDENEVRITPGEKGKAPAGRLFKKSPTKTSKTSKGSRPTAQRLKSALRTSVDKAKERGKTVQFPEDPAHEIPPARDDVVREGDKKPADPMAVLSRDGAAIDGTSSGAATTAFDDDDFMPGGVVMRDRALVKIGRHRGDFLTLFDEEAERRMPCARIDPTEQYIVAMTMTSVDIYSDWRLPCVERAKGFKRLVFSIPLAGRTSLTLFNQVDKTLSLTCPWTAVYRQTMRQMCCAEGGKSTSAWDRVRHGNTAEHFGMERAGTGVFVLIFQEHSRALDWHWYLAGQLEYRLPKQIEIRLPALATSVRIPVPSDAPSLTINRDAIAKEMWDLILASHDRRHMFQVLGHVPALEFAWECGAALDWVAYNTTVTGKDREWGLLASFARCADLKTTRVLQLRDAAHYVTDITLDTGVKLKEPASIEGYLMRQTSDLVRSQALYVAVNDGYAFLAPAALADPPLLPKKAGSTPADLFPDVQKEFLANERRRISRFISRCVAVMDLRDIASVRLTKPQDQPKADSDEEGEENMSHDPVPREGESDDREFQVELRNGQTVKFEAHTPAVAAEWVARFRALVEYWTVRRRVNARQEMDAVAGAAALDLTLGQTPHWQLSLSRLWNWCVIDGCRAITMEAPLFMKQGKWPKFRQYLAVLSNGRLTCFRINGNKAMQRKHSWPLFGAYAYSGLMALDELQENNSQSAVYPKARIYEDGLQATDDAEDTTLAIAITWPTGRWAPPQPWEIENPDGDVQPPKSVFRKDPLLLLCRARSKVSPHEFSRPQAERQVPGDGGICCRSAHSKHPGSCVPAKPQLHCLSVRLLHRRHVLPPLRRMLTPSSSATGGSGL